MLSQSMVCDRYGHAPIGRMFIHVFPEGVVAFDFDAPIPLYERGQELRGLFWSKVLNLAQIASEMYNLGKFWVVSTQSGFHVIFENLREDWPMILKWATQQWLWDGVERGMCKGYAGYCFRHEYVRLRVGRKLDREFDLEWRLGSLDDAPDFVKEHATMIEVLRRLNV